MGRGNTYIRETDGDAVTTYYIDISAEFDSEKTDLIEHAREMISEELSILKSFGEKRRAVIQSYKEGRLLDPSDDEVWERMSDVERMNFDDLLSNIRSVPGLTAIPKERAHYYNDNYCNGDALKLAEGKRVIVVVDDNENSIAVGVIPSYDEDDVMEAVAVDFAEASDDEAKEKTAEMIRNKWREEYVEEANIVMKKIHEMYDLRIRTCAWTSSSLPRPEEFEAGGGKYY